MCGAGSHGRKGSDSFALPDHWPPAPTSSGAVSMLDFSLHFQTSGSATSKKSLMLAAAKANTNAVVEHTHIIYNIIIIITEIMGKSSMSKLMSIYVI